MKRILLYIAALLLAAASLSAQRPVKVHWTTEIESTSATAGIIRWTADIDAGWHIYGLSIPAMNDVATPEPTSFKIDDVAGLVLDGPVQANPAAVTHFDETLKLKLPIFDGHVVFTQRFHLADGTPGATIAGTIRYMACTDNSCTPPTGERFEVTFGVPVENTTATDNAAPAPAPAAIVHDHPQYDTAELWAPVEIGAPATGDATVDTSSSWWGILGFGFLGGLLALLTPCVWPMIPMTVSFFLKKGKSRRRSVLDAVTYALSILIIYLILGIAITMLFGAGKLNEIATSAAFNVAFFIILVIFAISFFGAFDIKLPSRWANAIDSKAETTTGFISIFFMAFTLVLVSFSCTGPIIGTLLVEAASQASIVGPAVGMGGFALGLALPFGLFAFFPSLLKEMPRSGSWLNTVKVVLGFLELILSLKFLSVADLAYGWHILDREIFVALWIVLFALLGIYLLGKLRFSHDSPTDHVSIGRFFLATASFAMAVYLFPGMWGAPLKGVSAFVPPLSTQDFNLYGGGFKEFHDYDEGMAYAANNDMPVLVDFSGYACVNCRKMEAAVFDTPEVRAIIERDYVLIKLMVDDKQPLEEPVEVEEYGSKTLISTVGERWSYLQRHKFGINSQPYYVILRPDGTPLLPTARAYDENAGDFTDWLNAGVAAYEK